MLNESEKTVGIIMMLLIVSSILNQIENSGKVNLPMRILLNSIGDFILKKLDEIDFILLKDYEINVEVFFPPLSSLLDLGCNS